MLSFALLFPGQGSQFVGMGRSLFERRPDLLGSTSDDLLGWSLSEMCLGGPEEALTRTEHAQPALYALSYTLWSCLRDETLSTPDGAAGHSLGEYTALAASGALSFEDGLQVVARRGQAMAEAADLEASGMAALIGADLDLAQSVVDASDEIGGRLQVANLNAPGQVVVAGSARDIDWLVDNASDLGVRRVIPLKVAGAFHSTFMEPALAALEEALEGVGVSTPLFRVWSNTTAEPHDIGDLKKTLVRQVVSPVRFADSLVSMRRAGIDTFIHVGPGDVTAGMARKTVPDATVIVVSDIADLGAAVDSIGTM